MKQYAVSFACYNSYGGWSIKIGRKRNVVPLFGLGLGAVSHCTNVSFPLVLDFVSNASAYEEVIMEKCGCLVSYDYDGPGCGEEMLRL